MKHSERNIKNEPITMTYIALNTKSRAVLIGCFFIEQSSCTEEDEELRTNDVKAKTCLFTGQVDVRHMPFIYVILIPEITICVGDKRILAITNLET